MPCRFGNSPEAGIRLSTVRRLFRKRLLTGKYKEGEPQNDMVAEEDADLVSDGIPAALSNFDVLIDAFEDEPTESSGTFQLAAIYELIGLGLSAVFRFPTERLRDSARIPVATLAIGKSGAINAALLAISILANSRPEVREKLRAFREKQTAKVLKDTLQKGQE